MGSGAPFVYCVLSLSYNEAEQISPEWSSKGSGLASVFSFCKI